MGRRQPDAPSSPRKHATTKRSYRLNRRELGGATVLLHEERDEHFDIGVGETRSEAWVMLTIHSKDTSEVRVLEARDPRGEFRVVEPRRAGHEYYVDHHGDRFFIRTNDKGPNSPRGHRPHRGARRAQTGARWLGTGRW
jgi:oligopeptidase B